jgi:hypothetical protein
MVTSTFPSPQSGQQIEGVPTAMTVRQGNLRTFCYRPYCTQASSLVTLAAGKKCRSGKNFPKSN